MPVGFTLLFFLCALFLQWFFPALDFRGGGAGQFSFVVGAFSAD